MDSAARKSCSTHQWTGERTEPSQEQNICGCLGHICPFVVAAHTRNPQRLCGCLLLGWAECTHPRPRAPTWRAARGGRVCGLGGGGLPCRWPDALSCRGHGMGISCHASRALQMAHMGPLPQPAWRNPCGHWTVGRTVDELWPGAPSPSAVHPPPSSTIPAANFPLSSPSAAFSARLIRRSWLRRAPPLFV